MKKYLLLPAIVLALFSACKPIDPVDELNVYNDCVVYSIDTINTTEDVVTDFAKIKVTADMSVGAFTLDFVDFKLQPNANVQNITVKGLGQYIKDVKDPEDGTVENLYTFFKSEGYANTEGGSVRDLRFCWLSTVYWCTFASGQNRVWSLPSNTRIYANRNDIQNGGEMLLENSLQPRYDMIFNTANRTVTLIGQGVKLPYTTDASLPETPFAFREFKLENLPLTFNPTGFRVANIEELKPVTDGQRDKFKITDFRLFFDVAYEGDHRAIYNITNLETGMTLHVTTTFGYDDKPA